MDKFIKKELIGRLFRFHGNNLMVIIGVRKCERWAYYGYKIPQFNRYEVLVGRLYETTDRSHYQIEVYSWYDYNRNNMFLECRSDKKAIRNCMRKQPDKIKWHTGRKIDITGSNVRITESNGKYWKEYLNFN